MACALAALLALGSVGTASAQEEVDGDDNYVFVHDAAGLGGVEMFLQDGPYGAEFIEGSVAEGEQVSDSLPPGEYLLRIFDADIVSTDTLATATVTLLPSHRTTATLVLGEGGEPEVAIRTVANSPVMSTTPSAVAPGQELHISGIDFPQGVEILLTFGEGPRAPQVTTSASGDYGVLAVVFTVPQGLAGPPGSTVRVPLTATDPDGGTTYATTTFDVVAPVAPSAPSTRPRVVTPSRVEAGGGGAAPSSGPVPVAMAGVLAGVAAGIAVLAVVRRSAT